MSLGHFQYKMFSVTAEGFAVDELVPVEITDEGHFKIETPHYINAVMSVHEVEATDLQTAIDFYGKLCEKYQSMRLQPGSGKKVLLVNVDSDVRACTFVSLGYIEDTEVDGRLLKHESIRQHYVVIPDTPENRQKLDALIGSIKVAAQLMIDFRETADPVAYLHAIEFQRPLDDRDFSQHVGGPEATDDDL